MKFEKKLFQLNFASSPNFHGSNVEILVSSWLIGLKVSTTVTSLSLSFFIFILYYFLLFFPLDVYHHWTYGGLNMNLIQSHSLFGWKTVVNFFLSPLVKLHFNDYYYQNEDIWRKVIPSDLKVSMLHPMSKKLMWWSKFSRTFFNFQDDLSKKDFHPHHFKQIFINFCMEIFPLDRINLKMSTNMMKFIKERGKFK